MTAPVFIALPGDEPLAEALAASLDGKVAVLAYRRFPDGESYLRIDDSLSGKRSSSPRAWPGRIPKFRRCCSPRTWRAISAPPASG